MRTRKRKTLAIVAALAGLASAGTAMGQAELFPAVQNDTYDAFVAAFTADAGFAGFLDGVPDQAIVDGFSDNAGFDGDFITGNSFAVFESTQPGLDGAFFFSVEFFAVGEPPFQAELFNDPFVEPQVGSLQLEIGTASQNGIAIAPGFAVNNMFTSVRLTDGQVLPASKLNLQGIPLFEFIPGLEPTEPGNLIGSVQIVDPDGDISGFKTPDSRGINSIIMTMLIEPAVIVPR